MLSKCTSDTPFQHSGRFGRAGQSYVAWEAPAQYCACPKQGDLSLNATLENLRSAVDTHNVEALISLFSPTIIVRSPVTQQIRMEGFDQVSDLFRQVFPIIRNMVVYDTVSEGDRKHVIFWRGYVGSHYLEEANLMRFDDEGRIAEMTIFMRPLSGLLALSTQITAALTERHGKVAASIVRAMFGGYAAIYQLSEPFGLSFARVGVPVPPESR